MKKILVLLTTSLWLVAIFGFIRPSSAQACCYQSFDMGPPTGDDNYCWAIVGTECVRPVTPACNEMCDFCDASPHYSIWVNCGASESCFLSGTKISIPDGEKEIEKIKTGDIIQGLDPETREITSSVVSEPYSVTRDHYYVVKTESGREVKTTDEHPFYVGKELPQARSLKDKIINFYSMVIIYFKDGLQAVKTSFRQ